VTEADVRIREVQPEEYVAVGDLVVAAYASIESDVEYLERIRDTGGRAAVVPVLVAVGPDGAILGTVTYVPGPGPYAECDDPAGAGVRVLAVSPHAQGRGVGRALVLACIERARRDDRSMLLILTRPSMRSAQSLYESLGFERDPATDSQLEPGEWLWGYRLAL
jgi:ribosomal protein S18 acetylase RimI-like enzyme